MPSAWERELFPSVIERKGAAVAAGVHLAGAVGGRKIVVDVVGELTVGFALVY